MKLPSLVAAVSAIGLLASPAAYAGPSFCTGTTTVITSGTFVPGSDLVNVGPGTSTGNCIQASDKIFGGFTVSGAITGSGSAGWLFTMPAGPANVTVALQGLVGPSSTGTVDYDVAVDPATSNGALISELEKDFTFNSLGAGSTATLTGAVTPTPVSFSGGDLSNAFQCTRTASSSTCPQFGFFTPLQATLTVDEKIVTGVNTNVTAFTDTVFQAVDEPGSPLAFIGIMLIVFGALYRYTARREREAAHRMWLVNKPFAVT